jgi:hypothetical protein
VNFGYGPEQLGGGKKDKTCTQNNDGSPRKWSVFKCEEDFLELGTINPKLNLNPSLNHTPKF